MDEPDGRVCDLPEPEVSDEDDSPSCTYLILSSQEKLQVNVTPQAISVLRDVLEVNSRIMDKSVFSKYGLQGAQWLSGRVLDSRLRGHRFEPHRYHCIVSLSKTH